MSKRMVNDEFWTDTYVEDLDPSEKLLFLYLITNPLCNVAGIYEIKVKRMAYETGFDKEMVEKILLRFEKDDKVLRQDEWIIVVNFAKNQANNPNMLQGMQRIIDALPDKIKALKGFSSLPHFTSLNLILPNLTTPNGKKMKNKKFFVNQYRERAGKEPIKSSVSEKQMDMLIRDNLIPIFKKAVNEVHDKDYFAEDDDVTDYTKENSRLNAQIKLFWNKCKKDISLATEVINWFGGDYGKFCNWKPSVCFRKETVVDYKNRPKERKVTKLR